MPIPDLAVSLFQDLKLLSGNSEYLFPKRKASKKPHIASDTLNDAVASLFRVAYGKRKPGPNYMAKLDVGHFTIHDLRRTFRTLLSKIVTRREVAEKSMNHTLKVLNKLMIVMVFFPKRQAALNNFAERIMPLVKYKPLLSKASSLC